MKAEPQRSRLRSEDLPRVAQTLDFTCGPACFDSLLQLFGMSSPGEIAVAEFLGTLELGFTPPLHIVELARLYGFDCKMHEDAPISQLKRAYASGAIVFVTWWDEDAGHYSLVKQIAKEAIVLMDPWFAREGRDKHLELNEFSLYWNQRGARLITAQLTTRRETAEYTKSSPAAPTLRKPKA